MNAYHNKPELKQMMVAEAIQHREMDQIKQGRYSNGKAGEAFEGCAVGCTIHSVNLRLGKKLEYNDHGAYETELGIPRVLARLEDGIFENLPQVLALTWPQRFLEAPAVGADLSGVGDKFLLWLLVDPEDGVIRFAKKDVTRKAIQDVADLYAKKIAGGSVTLEEWKKVRDAAEAYAAAEAAAAAAADAAAAAYAAAAEAYAAAAAAAAAARARKKARVRQSEKLLELMAAAPTAVPAVSIN